MHLACVTTMVLAGATNVHKVDSRRSVESRSGGTIYVGRVRRRSPLAGIARLCMWLRLAVTIIRVTNLRRRIHSLIIGPRVYGGVDWKLIPTNMIWDTVGSTVRYLFWPWLIVVRQRQINHFGIALGPGLRCGSFS